MTKIAMRFVTTTDIPIGDALVQIRLTRSDYEEKTSGVIMTRLEEFHTDADGFLQVDLLPATALYHVTTYDTVQDIAIHHDFIVPEVEDPNTVLLLPDLIVPPDTTLSSLPYDEAALAVIIQAKAETIAAAIRAAVSAEYAQSAIESTAASAAIAEAAKVVIQAAEISVSADAAEVRSNTVLAANYTSDALQHKNDAEAAALSANNAKQVAIDESAIAVQAAAAAKISENTAAESITISQAAVVTTTAARDQAVSARNTSVAAKDEAVDAKNTTVQKAAELAAQLHAFNEIYIGKFASNPTTDGNGNPLKVGAIYENTTEGKLYQYESDLQWHPYDEESQQQMNNALLSANSAAASAGSATASMNAAEASKIAAQTARTGAEAAKTAADASATTATQSKDAAVAASNTAVAAKDTASQKAVDAAASASSAAASAATAADFQIPSDWSQTDNTKKDFIKNKPVLAAVATSGLKADVNLGNVDNTSDPNKPVSTAQAAAIALKFDKTGGAVSGNITLSGSNRRLLGDMSNVSHSARLMLQTSVVDSPTVVGVIPSGTGAQGQVNAYNNSNPDNSASVQIHASASRTTLLSAVTGTGTALPLCFDTLGAERMRLGTNGEFLFGTVLSGGPVVNRTNGFRLDPTTRAISIRAGAPCEFGLSGNNGTHIQFYTDNGTTFVGAGTIVSNGNTTAFATSSDYRLKHSVKELKNSIDWVCRLRPVSWKWNNGGKSEGFIAHEAQQVCPEAVTGVKDGMKMQTMYDKDGNEYSAPVPDYQAIDASLMMGRVVGAIQELKSSLDVAMSMIAMLEAKVAALKAKP